MHLVVERDNKYIRLLLEAEKEFWDKLCKIKLSVMVKIYGAEIKGWHSYFGWRF